MSDIDRNEIAEVQALLDSLGPVTRTFFAEVDLGDQAREFVESPIGRAVVGFAQQDIQEAHLKLAKIAPWRWRRIQQLQNNIAVAERVLGYFSDLIVRGKVAEKALEERDDS